MARTKRKSRGAINYVDSARSPRTLNVNSASRVGTRRQIAVWGVVLLSVVFALIPVGDRGIGGMREGATPIEPIPTFSRRTSDGGFGGLANMKPNEIVEADIARLNLLAAGGLPGAETLQVESSLAELNRWAEHVARETDRHMYRFIQDASEYENSEAYFRMLMLIVALQGDLGVHYNSKRINTPDFSNSKDLFIHGMIGSDNGGTCVSMPTLYVAIGRRLGYPMKLVLTKGHVFARWDAPEHKNPSLRARFNIEATDRGLSTPHDDEYKTWPYALTQAELTNDWFLRSLTPAEELAVFLMQRGHCLEDTDRAVEAQTAYAMAQRLAPKSPEAADYLAALVRKERGVGYEIDQHALASQTQWDNQRRWLKEKRREAEQIARKAINRPQGVTRPPLFRMRHSRVGHPLQKYDHSPFTRN